MAKNTGYDTKELMKQSEERYQKPEPKERATGQSRHNRSNGKAVGGGKRSFGVAK